METCLVLSARRYDFKADDGNQVRGVSLSYITDDIQTVGDTLGSVPMSVTAPPELFAQLGPLPGFYQMDFRQRPGPKGKPTLTLCGLKFLRPFSANGNQANP